MLRNDKIFIIVALKYVVAVVTQKESNKAVYNFHTSDFAEVLETTYFVDKSLLIKDIFAEKEAVFATAPRRFGKSVVIDMIRRFVEIEVDENGNEKPDKMATANYKLFTQTKLYRYHREFFDEHFGRYPVIFIDFTPLSDVVGGVDMLQQMRLIIVKMFREHRYLLNVESVWRDRLFLEDFKDYISIRRSKILNQDAILRAIRYLPTVLTRHFNKRIFVLVDNYDAFANGVIHSFRDCNQYLPQLFLMLVSDLLHYNTPQVSRTFVTGVLNVAGGYLVPCTVVFSEFWFMRNHTLNKYYGLTPVELDEILIKATENITERKKLRNDIDKYYGGYTVVGQADCIYNTWSVLHYLEKRRVENYWAKPDDFVNAVDVFDLRDYQEIFLKILHDGTLNLYIKKALTRYNLFDLNTIHSPVYIHEPIRYEVFYLYYHYIFQHGYLTEKDEMRNPEEEDLTFIIFASIKIPNLETKSLFVHLLRNAVMNEFSVKFDLIETVNNNINLISERMENDNTFKDLYLSFQHLFVKSNYKVKYETNFWSFLFLIFKCRFDDVRKQVFSVSEEISTVDVILRNDHNVTFIIETQFSKGKDMRIQDLRAHRAILRIIRNEYKNVLERHEKKKLVYLGLSFCIKGKSLSFTYSKSLKKGDTLLKTKLLSMSNL